MLGVQSLGMRSLTLENVIKQSGGAFAEYAISHAKHTTSRPPQVSAEDGACLPVAGLAALQSLRDYAGLTLDGNYKGDSCGHTRRLVALRACCNQLFVHYLQSCLIQLQATF